MSFSKNIAAFLLIGAVVFWVFDRYNEQDRKNPSDVVRSTVAKTESIAPDNEEDLNNQIDNSRQNAITRAVERASPAVVGISVKSIQEYPASSLFDYFYYGGPISREVSGLGSGFIISQDGYILSNDHVIGDAREIKVALTDRKTYDGRLVESDKSLDIALLKIEGNNFPFLNLGRSDDILVGEWVISLGNPFGLFDFNNQPSVTVGVVSAVERDFGGQAGETYIYQDMIQTDASINPGNSGGPLLNSSGDVIGMNTFILTGGSGSRGSIGIGFAIPVNKIDRVVEELKTLAASDRNYWTGILSGYDVSSVLANRLQLNTNTGFLIWRIARLSPAEKANLRQGDVIIEVNGSPVRNLNELQRSIQLADPRPGKSLQLTVSRNNQIYETMLTLERSPR